MKPLFALFVFISVLSASAAAMAQITRVPSPLAEDAAFPEGSLMAEGPDGARLIVGGAAMITATSGSRILEITQSEQDGVRITLGEGAFRVHVGSKPVVLEVGGSPIEAVGAVLLTADREGARLVQVVETFQGGRVEVKQAGPTAVQVTEPGQGADGDASAPLEAGKAYRITSTTNPEPVSGDEKKHLEDLSDRLVGTRKPIVLKPVNIEDPNDLAGAAARAGEAMELAEIEAVEVEIEADCVEICTD
jgi:hypothetical protein